MHGSCRPSHIIDLVQEIMYTSPHLIDFVSEIDLLCKHLQHNIQNR